MVWPVVDVYSPGTQGIGRNAGSGHINPTGQS